MNRNFITSPQYGFNPEDPVLLELAIIAVALR